MTTGELVKQLSSRLGITQVEAKKIIQAFFSEISQHLAKDKNIILRDFGTFGCKQVSAQRRFMPGKNCQYDIPEHKRTFFRTAKKLKAQLNTPSSE